MKVVFDVSCSKKAIVNVAAMSIICSIAPVLLVHLHIYPIQYLCRLSGYVCTLLLFSFSTVMVPCEVGNIFCRLCFITLKNIFVLIVYTQKVLTYIVYRAVSEVFRTIDPLPQLHPASVSSPCTKGGGYTLAGRRGANISEDARHWVGFLQYNPSTCTHILLFAFHEGNN